MIYFFVLKKFKPVQQKNLRQKKFKFKNYFSLNCTDAQKEY